MSFDWSNPSGDTGGGSTDTGGGGDTSQFSDVGAPTSVTVPSNIIAWIQQAAIDNGLPDWTPLAAAIQFSIGFGKAEQSDIEEIASQVAQSYRQFPSGGPNAGAGADPMSRLEAAVSQFSGIPQSLIHQYGGTKFTIGTPSAVGKGPSQSLTGFKSIVDLQTAYDLVEQYTGDRPSSDNDPRVQSLVGMEYGYAIQQIEATPEAKDFRQQGAKIAQVHQWADSLYASYGLPKPTTDEVKEIISRGYDQNSLATYLRGRPYGSGNLGQFADSQIIANRYAQQHLGRLADPAEINFLIANNITSTDQVDAYFQQLKQRLETGDPGFQWAADPKTWTSLQQTFQSLWQQAGMTGEVDPHLVNQAAQGKWQKQDIQNYIDGLAAPGFTGAKIGQVNLIRSIADQWKQTWYPTQKATNTELDQFISKGMTSDQIRQFYGSMPKNLSDSGQSLGSLTDPSHLPRQNAQTGGTTTSG